MAKTSYNNVTSAETLIRNLQETRKPSANSDEKKI